VLALRADAVAAAEPVAGAAAAAAATGAATAGATPATPTADTDGCGSGAPRGGRPVVGLGARRASSRKEEKADAPPLPRGGQRRGRLLPAVGQVGGGRGWDQQHTRRVERRPQWDVGGGRHGSLGGVRGGGRADMQPAYCQLRKLLGGGGWAGPWPHTQKRSRAPSNRLRNGSPGDDRWLACLSVCRASCRWAQADHAARTRNCGGVLSSAVRHSTKRVVCGHGAAQMRAVSEARGGGCLWRRQFGVCAWSADEIV